MLKPKFPGFSKRKEKEKVLVEVMVKFSLLLLLVIALVVSIASRKINKVKLVIFMLSFTVQFNCMVAATLLFVLPLIWVKHVVIAATIQLNCTVKDSIKMTSREFFLGRKPSLNDIKKTSFGSLVEVVDADKTNDVNARSRTAIALYPLLDDIGSWSVVMLDSKHVVNSRCFHNVQPDVDSMALLNAYAKEGVAGTGAIAEQIHAAFEQELFDMNHTEFEEVYKLEQCYHISYKKSMKMFGETLTYKAAFTEIFDIIHKDCWLPVGYHTKADATSFMFLKDKRDKVDGTLLKIKCRHVISSMDNEEELDKISSETEAELKSDTIETRAPTPSWNVASIIFSEIAECDYYSKVMDVPSAFTWADNPYHHIVLLDEITTKIAIEIKPEWKQYMHKNGKMKIKLMKNQYGTPEAANLWNTYFTEFLIENGYAQNKIEPCMFVKRTESEKIVLLVYVDDVLVASNTLNGLDTVETMLKEKFGTKVSVSDEGSYDYLGIRVTHDRTNKSVYLHSNQYIQDMLHDVTSQACMEDIKQRESPSGTNLFQLDTTSKPLTASKAKLYHSIVAKLLWIAMRVRIDILMTVVYLASKVHCSTEHEFDKLKHLLGYLLKYPKLKVVIKGDKLWKEGILNIWVDASHAVHRPSMRSHIGVFISAGRGPILLKSVGAKRQTNSSTASEILALSTSIGLICGIANFLKSYEVEVKQIIIHEDNEAVLKLVTGSKPMNDTSKHMEIQRLFIKEAIEQDNMTIIHCKSEDMLADVLTKAMIGNQFKKLVVKLGLEFSD